MPVWDSSGESRVIWPESLRAAACLAGGDGGKKDRLNFQRYLHTSFCAANGCRTIAIYEYTRL
jgi:hypothetical protein